MSMAGIINERNRKSKLKHTIDSLVRSTLRARKGFNAVKRVEILSVAPVLRTRQVLIRGQAHGQAERRLYPLLIMASQVSFSDERDRKHPLEVNLGNGERIYMEKLSATRHKVQVRCDCKDFYFMWQYWNSKESALFGGKFPKYQRKTAHYPERNPDHVPGICKHLMTLADRLGREGIIGR